MSVHGCARLCGQRTQRCDECQRDTARRRAGTHVRRHADTPPSQAAPVPITYADFSSPKSNSSTFSGLALLRHANSVGQSVAARTDAHAIVTLATHVLDAEQRDVRRTDVCKVRAQVADLLRGSIEEKATVACACESPHGPQTRRMRVLVVRRRRWVVVRTPLSARH